VETGSRGQQRAGSGIWLCFDSIEAEGLWYAEIATTEDERQLAHPQDADH
jgi:hypothetical protein